ncbi:MAG: hypothetical protein ACLFP4_03650 [Spirochaetales bacterium]
MSEASSGRPLRGPVWVTVPEASLFARIGLALRGRWAVVAADRGLLEQLGTDPAAFDKPVPELVIATLDAYPELTLARNASPTLIVCDKSQIPALSMDVCDDVLVAPWSGPELRYRVSRMTPMRRYMVDGVRLEWRRHTVTIWSGSKRCGLELSAKQYVILDTLLRNNRPISRDVLCHMAGLSPGRAFDMQISRTRKKLRPVAEQIGVQITIEGDRASGFSLAVSKSSIP